MRGNYILRSDAIKAIEDLPNCYNGFSDTYDKAYIIGALEEVPSAQQWIPVSSGNLPDEGVNVITVVAFREWMEYKLNHIIDKESHEWYWDYVVAWMPIEPWKGGEA